MRIPVKTVLFIVLLVVAALSFREVSGRVLDWLKAMHGGGAQASHSK